MWLLVPSLNEFSVKWDPASKAEKAVLELHQTNYTEKYKQLRYHKLNIALFKEDGTCDVLSELIRPVVKTTLTYNGANNYKAILVNHNDLGFLKYAFDETSLGYFLSSVSRVDDVLTRMIVWHFLNEMVKDAKLKLERYV